MTKTSRTGTRRSSRSRPAAGRAPRQAARYGADTARAQVVPEPLTLPLHWRPPATRPLHTGPHRTSPHRDLRRVVRARRDVPSDLRHRMRTAVPIARRCLPAPFVPPRSRRGHRWCWSACSRVGPRRRRSAPPARAPPRPGVRPTVHYEEAQAHADDRIAFSRAAGSPCRSAPRARTAGRSTARRLVALPAGRRLRARDARARIDGRWPTAARRARSPRRRPATTARRRPVHARSTARPAATPATGTAGDRPTLRPRRHRRPGRPPPRGLRLPAVLGADRQLDPPRLGEDLDRRLLRRRGRRGRATSSRRGADGSTTVGWSGWTSSRMTNVINAAHAERRPRRPDRPELCLDASGLARQKALLGSPTARATARRQIAKAVRDRGADGVNLDFEPIASRLRRRVHGARAQGPLVTRTPSHQGYQLTFDTTGWIGNYPIEDATAPRRRRRHLHHGLRLPVLGLAARSARSPRSAARVRHPDTIAAYLARVPPSKVILGVPYYGRAWSTASDVAPLARTSRARSTAPRWPSSTRPRASSPPSTAAGTTRGGRGVDRPTGAKLHGDLRLRDDLAPALLRRRHRAQGEVRPDQRHGLRGVGIWALGYDGSRPELYAGARGQVHHRQGPADDHEQRPVSATRFSPDRDGHGDAVTMRLKVTGLVRWGYSVNAGQRGEVGEAIRSSSRHGHAPSFTWTGKEPTARGRQGRPLPHHALGRRCLEQPLAALVRRRGRPPAPRPSAVDLAGFLSPDGNGRGHARAHGLDRRPSRSPAPSGLLDTNGPSSGAGRSRPGRPGRPLDRQDPPGRRARRTAPTATVSAASTGPGTGRPIDRPVLVDRTIRPVRWSDTSFDPRGRQTSRATV